MKNATHRIALDPGRPEFLKHLSLTKTYLWDEQLQALELCIQHGMKVQIDSLEGELIL